MKTCAYCGRENDDAFVACLECGTELVPLEPPLPMRLSRRGRMALCAAARVMSGLAIAAMPALIFLVPLTVFAAIVYLPLYLPFLLSFLLKAQEWASLRWMLRIASAASVFMWLSGTANRPDFGDDVAGNIAGASHNFSWVWGSGIACTFFAVVIGLLWRGILYLRATIVREQV